MGIDDRYLLINVNQTDSSEYKFKVRSLIVSLLLPATEDEVNK